MEASPFKFMRLEETRLWGKKESNQHPQLLQHSVFTLPPLLVEATARRGGANWVLNTSIVLLSFDEDDDRCVNLSGAAAQQRGQMSCKHVPWQVQFTVIISV